MTSFYLTTHIIGLCSHHFIWHLVLLSGAHIFYPNTYAVEWCPCHFIPQIMLLHCTDFILSDNSCWWAVPTFYLTTQTVEWCPNHFTWRLKLLNGAHIILSDVSNCWVVPTSFYPSNHADGLWWHLFIWQFASKLILMFCATAGSIMLPAIPMCHQSAPTCWQFNVLQLTK